MVQDWILPLGPAAISLLSRAPKIGCFGQLPARRFWAPPLSPWMQLPSMQGFCARHTCTLSFISKIYAPESTVRILWGSHSAFSSGPSPRQLHLQSHCEESASQLGLILLEQTPSSPSVMLYKVSHFPPSVSNSSVFCHHLSLIPI